MSEFPVNATIFNTDPSWTAAQAVAEFDKWLTATKQLPGAQTPEALTIDTGSITPTRSMVIVDTEGAAASDDLSTILTSTMHDGAMVMIIAANAGRVVTVVHGVGAGGIELLGGANRNLSTSAWLMLRRSGTRWIECVLDLRLKSAAYLDILGTVSQSGGVPTGAIIERGSNANGEYVRFADGTQICTLRASVTDQAIDSAVGAIYTGTRTWTFPAEFSAAPVVSFIGRWGTGAGWGSSSDPSGTGVTLRFLDTTSRAIGTAVVMLATAIGRWF